MRTIIIDNATFALTDDYPIPSHSSMFNVSMGANLLFGWNEWNNADDDGDGVRNKKDKCPNTPAEAYAFIDKCGCPIDSDNDGVPDYLDKGPSTVKGAYGRIDSTGVPLDQDGDQVPDYLDECPGTPKEAWGFVDKVGCPRDSDGDGVPDYIDKCPNTPKEFASTVDSLGCPKDSDGDGVPDCIDKCPGTPKEAAGKVDANGCLLDSDGDGVPDYLDKCPQVSGTTANHGCPEVAAAVKQLFKKAMTGIQFETGKATIKPQSFPILDQIVTVLKENPMYNLNISGHTDNVGDPVKNQDLSERRAKAVGDYFVGKGIEASRFKMAGYGQDKPVADNKTAQGRFQNRRVEFEVEFEDYAEQ